MEIGSAYALQVCLLQVPAMVAFSAFYAPEKMGSVAETFTYVSHPRASDSLLTPLQADFPSLGYHRHHAFGVLDDLHLH